MSAKINSNNSTRNNFTFLLEKDLTNICLVKIFSFLTPKELARIDLCNRSMRQITEINWENLKKQHDYNFSWGAAASHKKDFLLSSALEEFVWELTDLLAAKTYIVSIETSALKKKYKPLKNISLDLALFFRKHRNQDFQPNFIKNFENSIAEKKNLGLVLLLGLYKISLYKQEESKAKNKVHNAKLTANRRATHLDYRNEGLTTLKEAVSAGATLASRLAYYHLKAIPSVRPQLIELSLLAAEKQDFTSLIYLLPSMKSMEVQKLEDIFQYPPLTAALGDLQLVRLRTDKNLTDKILLEADKLYTIAIKKYRDKAPAAHLTQAAYIKFKLSNLERDPTLRQQTQALAFQVYERALASWNNKETLCPLTQAAYRKFQLKNYNTISMLLEGAVDLWQKNNELSSLRLSQTAFVQFQLEEYQKAKKYYENALDLGKNDAPIDVLADLAEVYVKLKEYEKAAEIFTKLKAYEKADECYTELLKCNIKLFPETLCKIALLKDKLKDYMSTSEFFEKVAKLVDESHLTANFLRKLAKTRFLLQKFSLAKTTYEYLFKKDQNSFSIKDIERFAITKLMLNEPENANALFDKVLEKYDDISTASDELLIYAAYTKSILDDNSNNKLIEIVLQRDSTDFPTKFLLPIAMIKYKKKDLQGADKIFDSCIYKKKDVIPIAYFYNSATIKQKLNDWEGAERLYDTIIKQFPGLIPKYILVQAAETKVRLSDWEGAERLYDTIIKEFPGPIPEYILSPAAETKARLNKISEAEILRKLILKKN